LFMLSCFPEGYSFSLASGFLGSRLRWEGQQSARRLNAASLLPKMTRVLAIDY
jgi:hypothetical protein